MMDQPKTSVLLLEDNPALAASIEFALATYGLEVIGPFYSNRAGMAAIRSETIQVAILDLDLGQETSLLTAGLLRDLGVPFLFMSGHDMDEEIPEEFQNEVFLPKPVDPETLVETLQELVGRTSIL